MAAEDHCPTCALADRDRDKQYAFACNDPWHKEGRFGACAYCDEDGMVKVNGVAVCLAHMDQVFTRIGVGVRKIIKGLAK